MMTTVSLMTVPKLAPWVEYWLSWPNWQRLGSLWCLALLMAALPYMLLVHPYQQQGMNNQLRLQQLQQSNRQQFAQLAQQPSLTQLQAQIAQLTASNPLPLQQQVTQLLARGAGTLLVWQPATASSAAKVVLHLDYATALRLMTAIQQPSLSLPIHQLMLFSADGALNLQLQLQVDLADG